VAYRDEWVAARTHVAQLEHEVERRAVEHKWLGRERRRLKRALTRRRTDVATELPRARARAARTIAERERALDALPLATLQERAAHLAIVLETDAPAIAQLRDEVERLRARLASGALRANWQWPVWSCLLAGMLIAAPIYLLGYTVFVWLLGRVLF
jgi:hypothetical protein